MNALRNDIISMVFFPNTSTQTKNEKTSDKANVRDVLQNT